jgi:hypothetical protein
MITGMDLNTLYSLLNAILISLGVWMLSRLFWMFIYQLKYGGDYGDRYLSGDISKEEKRELKKNFSWIKRLKK